MKNALVLSGMMKSYKINLNNIFNKIIKPHNTDIYIVTCNNDNGGKGSINKDIKLKFLEYDSKLFLEDIINTLSNFHENIKNKIIHTKVFDERDGKSYSFLSLNIFYKLYTALEMIENYEEKNKFKYDNIIYCRPDLKNIPNLSIDNIENNNIYSLKWPGRLDNKFNVICDMLAFGDRETMGKYLSIGKNINTPFGIGYYPALDAQFDNTRKNFKNKQYYKDKHNKLFNNLYIGEKEFIEYKQL